MLKFPRLSRYNRLEHDIMCGIHTCYKVAGFDVSIDGNTTNSVYKKIEQTVLHYDSNTQKPFKPESNLQSATNLGSGSRLLDPYVIESHRLLIQYESKYQKNLVAYNDDPEILFCIFLAQYLKDWDTELANGRDIIALSIGKKRGEALIKFLNQIIFSKVFIKRYEKDNNIYFLCHEIIQEANKGLNIIAAQAHNATISTKFNSIYGVSRNAIDYISQMVLFLPNEQPLNIPGNAVFGIFKETQYHAIEKTLASSRIGILMKHLIASKEMQFWHSIHHNNIIESIDNKSYFDAIIQANQILITNQINAKDFLLNGHILSNDFQHVPKNYGIHHSIVNKAEPYITNIYQSLSNLIICTAQLHYFESNLLQSFGEFGAYVLAPEFAKKLIDSISQISSCLLKDIENLKLIITNCVSQNLKLLHGRNYYESYNHAVKALTSIEEQCQGCNFNIYTQEDFKKKIQRDAEIIKAFDQTLNVRILKLKLDIRSGISSSSTKPAATIHSNHEVNMLMQQAQTTSNAAQQNTSQNTAHHDYNPPPSPQPTLANQTVQNWPIIQQQIADFNYLIAIGDKLPTASQILNYMHDHGAEYRAYSALCANISFQNLIAGTLHTAHAYDSAISQGVLGAKENQIGLTSIREEKSKLDVKTTNFANLVKQNTEQISEEEKTIRTQKANRAVLWWLYYIFGSKEVKEREKKISEAKQKIKALNSQNTKEAENHNQQLEKLQAEIKECMEIYRKNLIQINNNDWSILKKIAVVANEQRMIEFIEKMTSNKPEHVEEIFFREYFISKFLDPLHKLYSLSNNPKTYKLFQLITEPNLINDSAPNIERVRQLLTNAFPQPTDPNIDIMNTSLEQALQHCSNILNALERFTKTGQKYQIEEMLQNGQLILPSAILDSTVTKQLLTKQTANHNHQQMCTITILIDETKAKSALCTFGLIAQSFWMQRELSETHHNILCLTEPERIYKVPDITLLTRTLTFPSPPKSIESKRTTIHQQLLIEANIQNKKTNLLCKIS